MKTKKLKWLLERAAIDQEKIKTAIFKHEVLLKLKQAELTFTEQKINEYKKLINNANK